MVADIAAGAAARRRRPTRPRPRRCSTRTSTSSSRPPARTPSSSSGRRSPAALERVTDPGTRQVLTWVRDLFGLTVVERHLAWYLLNGRLSAGRARTVTSYIDRLLVRLRPHAQDLVDAFGYEQAHLRAPIASGAEQARQDEARAYYRAQRASGDAPSRRSTSAERPAPESSRVRSRGGGAVTARAAPDGLRPAGPTPTGGRGEPRSRRPLRSSGSRRRLRVSTPSEGVGADAPSRRRRRTCRAAPATRLSPAGRALAANDEVQVWLASGPPSGRSAPSSHVLTRNERDRSAPVRSRAG